MATENTGYKGYSTLLKVTNDGNNSPLDINNNLCSESGLPQATKSNTIGDPDYIAPIYDIVMCPLPATGSIQITNNNNPAVNNVNISTVTIDGTEVVLSGGSFPITPGQTVNASYSTVSGTSSTITLSANAATDSPVKIFVPTPVNYQECLLLISNNVAFTNINLSSFPPISITLEAEGTLC